MNKLFLVKHPELFQGEKFLSKAKNYFEGWYFKNTNEKNGISFIPGISINNRERKAFIQVITNDASYYVNYDIEDFSFSFEPFYIQIGENYFSLEYIYIDIRDDKQGLNIFGEVKYANNRCIKSGFLNPNIMGPFAFFPFMECNHAILCMKARADGLIRINGTELEFNDGIGYIEKDWGGSFPKSYLWCQGNNFENPNASFMISIADIPFVVFDFTGLICTLLLGEEEYRFSTYNNAKIVRYVVDENSLNVELKKGSYTLIIQSDYGGGFKLSAPVNGKMEKDIKETISGAIHVVLKHKDEIVFSDVSYNCGLEIVK